jgi:hypothetical protein
MTSDGWSLSQTAFSSRRLTTALCLILLALAGSEFLVRGPVRALRTATHFNDFLSPYIQAKALRLGLDPYSPQVLLRLWPADAPHFLFLPVEVSNGTLVANRGFPTAYPITAFVLIAPFSVLPWNLAYALWLAVNCVLFALMLGALVSLAGLSYRNPAAILLIAGTLALAPFHTGLVTANVTLVAVELSVIAIWTVRRNLDFATAALLATATGLKPQIGLCFLLYYLVRRRWRVFGLAMLALACLAAAGLLRLELGHTPWLANYISDNHILLETGVLGNFTDINPTRFGLINLQVALYPLLGGISMTNYVSRVTGAALLFAWLTGMLRRYRSGEYELLDVSAIAVISLLPIYHRFYDATLLVLPLCWVIVSYRRSRMSAVLTLLLMLPFLVPGGTLLETMEINGRIPGMLIHRAWWEAFVMAHQVWLLLLLSVLLLYQMFAYQIYLNPKDRIVREVKHAIGTRSQLG